MLVLGDGRMGYALLIRIENTAGQRKAFPARFEQPIRPSLGVDISTHEAA
jgi:hypothetical protein